MVVSSDVRGRCNTVGAEVLYYTVASHSSMVTNDGSSIHGLCVTVGSHVLLSSYSDYQPHDCHTSNRSRRVMLILISGYC